MRMFQFGKYFKGGPLGIKLLFYAGLSTPKKDFLWRLVDTKSSFLDLLVLHRNFVRLIFYDIIRMYRNNTNNNKNKQRDNNNNDNDNGEKQNNNILNREETQL